MCSLRKQKPKIIIIVGFSCCLDFYLFCICYKEKNLTQQTVHIGQWRTTHSRWDTSNCFVYTFAQIYFVFVLCVFLDSVLFSLGFFNIIKINVMFTLAISES